MIAWFRRLTRYVRRPQLDDELADEIQMHIALREQALIDRGLDPRDAASEARRRFGNIVTRREESREMWTFRTVETVAQDLRYTGRMLRRSPAFAVVAVTALGIAIGSAVAVFTLVNAVLLRPLPVAKPDELVILKWRSPGTAMMPAASLSGNWTQNDREQSSTSFSWPTFDTLRRESPAPVRVIGFAGPMSFSVAIDGIADIASGQVVSGNYFDTLGLTPAAGRLLTEADDTPSSPPVAVISEAMWRARLGASPAVIGRVISVNAVPVTIVGVMPKGFTGTLQVDEAPAITVPLALRDTLQRDATSHRADSWWLLMMARLPSGVGTHAARDQLESSFRQSVAAGNPTLPAADIPSLEFLPGAYGQVETRGGMRQPLRVMTLIVTIVLLVSCAIVASLLLARGQVRRREIAVRVAIGAQRTRVVRQLFTEGLVLAFLGSAVGIAVARWIAAALVPALGGSSEHRFDLSLDWRVVAFTAGLAAVSSVLFALVPALRATEIRVASGLQGDGRTMTATRERRALARVLIAVQVALTVVLVAAAALLVRSALNLRAIPAGFDASNLLIFSLDPMRNGYTPARAQELYRALLDRLTAIPGVRSATLSSSTLIGGGGSSTLAALPSDPPVQPGSAAARAYFEAHGSFVMSIGDGFFSTMGIPLIRGRAILPSDTADAQPVVVINEALAQRRFNTTDALGKRLKTNFAPDAKVFEVVGVVANAKYTSLRRPAPPTMYFSYQQRPTNSPTFEVKAASAPLALASEVTAAVRQLDPQLPVVGLRTQTMQIERSLRSERFLARLAAVLGIVTLLLGGIGLFGLLAYDVARRTPEIGLRMALGAEVRAVRWMVMRQSLLLTLAGLLAGIPAALWSTRVLATFLFGVAPGDPVSFAGVAATMLLAAVAAAYFPARRAALVDPVIALRAE